MTLNKDSVSAKKIS